MDLAAHLAGSAGEVVSRDDLIQAVWAGYPGADAALTSSVSKLRRALTECGGEPERLQTVPKRGYRLLSTEADAGLPANAGAAPGHRGWLALTLVAVAIAATAVYTALSLRQPALANRPSIAVLPFEDLSPSGDQQWFARGLADELLNALARLDGVEVKARDSSFRVHDQGSSVSAMATTLGVQALLDGSVRKDGERVRITAQLIDGGSGTQLWSRSYDHSLENIFEIQEAIASSVVAELELRLDTGPDARIVDQATADTTAYQFYLRGHEMWQRRDVDSLQRAIDLYQQALARDPDYAAAWSGLAEANLVLATLFPAALPPEAGYARAREAATRALEIKPGLGRPHTTLGSLKLKQRQWAAAKQAMERALEINPDYATGHQWYALLLGTLGRNEAGLEHARKALALDPVAQQINYNLRFFLYRTGRYRELIEHMNRIQDLGIGKPAVWHMWRARAMIELGRLDEALAEIEAAAPLPQLFPAAPAAVRAVALARAGRSEAARQSLREALRIAETSEADVQNRVLAAEALTALGDLNEALAQIERTGLNDLTLGYLRGRPTFAALRKTPAYNRLLERVGLR